MSIIGTIYEDVTTDVLGQIGIWQWLVVMGSTVIMIPSIFSQYEDMFLINPPVEVACIPPERCEVVNASLCTVTSTYNATELECNKWHVKLFWLIWLKKSWLVFCEKKTEVLSLTMISRMGLMFGSVTFGLIADSFGRRVAISLDLFAQLCVGLVLIFCESRAWFELLVFLKTLFGAATVYMGLLLTCEIASNSWRTRLIAIASLPRILSITCMIPIANSFPNMETYNFMAALFVILLIILLRWIPESPQWLLFNRKIHKAETLLQKAAKQNSVSLCEEFRIRPVNQRAYNCLDEVRPSCARIFTTHNTKIIIFVALLLWSLISFRLSYIYAKIFRENNIIKTHIFAMLCSTMALAGLAIILSEKMLLRHILFINILLSGVCTTCEALFGHMTQIFSTVELGSKIVVYWLLINITPRLFAINVRATIFGCCHAIGQLGTISGYLIFVYQPPNNMVSISVDVTIMVCLLALSLVLVDVDGRELPDTIEDMDYFSELSKPLRWATQKTNSPSHEEVEMRIYSFGSVGSELSNRLEDRQPAQQIGCMNIMGRIVTIYQRYFSKT